MARRTQARLIALLALLFPLAACGAGDGRSAAAADAALTALQADDTERALDLAERAADGDARFVPLRDFVRGSASFAKGKLAARQADTPEAEPFAWQLAITHMRRARDAWQRAATSRDDWPAARRNVERALLELDDFRRRQEEADRRRRPPDRPKPKPRPLPQPEPDNPEPDAPPDAPKPIAELTRAEVLALYEKLAAKEAEKRAVRQKEQESRTDVVRDW
jgi:hypothetical protein